MTTTESKAFSMSDDEERHRRIEESLRVAQLVLTDELLMGRPSGISAAQVVAAMSAIVPSLPDSTHARVLQGCAYGGLLKRNPPNLRVVRESESPDDLRVNAYVEAFKSLTSTKLRTSLYSLLVTVKVQRLVQFNASVKVPQLTDPLLRQLLAETPYVIESVMKAVTELSEKPSGMNMFQKVI